jgi:hypothetical protein
MKTNLLQGALALACAVAASTAGATTYQIVDLGEDSTAQAINRKDQVAGESPAGHAALYTGGTWIDKHDRHHGSRADAIDRAGNMAGVEWDAHRLSYPMYYPRSGKDYGIPLPGGSVYSANGTSSIPPMGMAPGGAQVVGAYIAVQDGLTHCFGWHPGDAVATDLGMPAGYEICDAYGVNDAGVVVGQVWSENTGFAAFVYSVGSFTIVGPSGQDPVLTAVNGKGHATGNLSNAGALFWNGTALKKIAASGSLNLDSGTAIDSHDNIAGWGTNANGLTILLYSGRMLVDLVTLIDNAQGWNFHGAMPTGLADDGTIVGFALFDDGSGVEHTHGFMLVPDAP